MIKLSEGQTPPISSLLPKRTYKYFTRYQVLTNSNDLKKQAIKRIDIKVLNVKQDLHDNDLKKLGQNLKIFSSLQTIRLQLSLKNTMRRHILLKLLPGLRKLVSLKSLVLHSCIITDKGLVRLSQCIKRLRSLETIDFAFGFDKLSPQGLSVLTHCLEGADVLQSLDLRNGHTLETCLEVNGTKSISKRLSNFRLSFSCLNCGIASSLGPQKFYWYLKGLEPSQHLSLRLESYDNPVAFVFKKLNRTLEETQSFQHLKMNFFIYNENDEEGCMRFVENLKRLSCLTKLELDLYWTSSSSFFGLLSQNLGELKSLKHMSLSWGGWVNQISDDDFKLFSQVLRKLPSLESIDLRLSDCSKLTNQGLQDLKESLIELNLLQEIRFSFSGLPKIHDTGIQHLAQGLEMLPSLRSLHLSFTLKSGGRGGMGGKQSLLKPPPEISDQGVEALGQSLKKISSLKTVILFFSGFNQVTAQELEKFRESLAHLKCQVSHYK